MAGDDDGLDRLQDAVWLRILDSGIDEGYATMAGALCAYQAGLGTRQATAVAIRQARVGWLLAEGYTEREAALMVGVSERTVERDVADLKRLYGEDGRS